MKKYIYIVCVLMCLCAVFYLRKDIVDKMLFDGEAVHLVLGREYLIVPYSDKSDDPFAVSDTVKLIAIKGNFAQWQYRSGFKTSGEVAYFKHLARYSK